MDLSCPRVACLQHRQARARGVLTLTPARAVRSGCCGRTCSKCRLALLCRFCEYDFVCVWWERSGGSPSGGARPRATGRASGGGRCPASDHGARARGALGAGAKGVGGVGWGRMVRARARAHVARGACPREAWTCAPAARERRSHTGESGGKFMNWALARARAREGVRRRVTRPRVCLPPHSADGY